ncbi:hypothetical protein SSIG_07248 [Streptomyces filamentosus NRRL 11379]|nr:hypothetical protein SSIG_07248 [Streptomyces filamentosus NRRL 11379]
MASVPHGCLLVRVGGGLWGVPRGLSLWCTSLAGAAAHDFSGGGPCCFSTAIGSGCQTSLIQLHMQYAAK